MFRQGLKFFFEVIKVVLVSLAIVVPIRYFLIQPFSVKGESMMPNFQEGNYLIVDELSYRFNPPQRGDVVVFKFPYDKSQYYIKRIIGLPNELIEIKEGHVFVNHQKLNETDYLDFTVKTPGNISVKLGEEDYFVLGDNRTASYDSRAWGPLKRQYIIGHVIIRSWPLTQVGLIHAPNFSF